MMRPLDAQMAYGSNGQVIFDAPGPSSAYFEIDASQPMQYPMDVHMQFTCATQQSTFPFAQPFNAFPYIGAKFDDPLCSQSNSFDRSTLSNISAHPQPTLATSAVDSCQQIAHVLQCYQQGGEDADFVRKAVESLVKKLKDKRIELDALITAVTSSGKQASGCVTIQRSLDGRLQVAGRKGVPHVVYARIWRWPNVSKNELVKLPICSIATDHQDFICINPYHYERVVSNGMAPIADVGLAGDGVGSLPKSEFNGEMDVMPVNNTCAFPSWQQSGSMQLDQPTTVNMPLPNVFSNETMMLYQPNVLDQIQIPTINQAVDHGCTILYYEMDTHIGESFKAALRSGEHELSVHVDGGMHPHGENVGRFCLGALANVHRSEASEKARMHIGKGIDITIQRNGSVQLVCRSRTPIFVRSGFLDFLSNVPIGSKVHRFTSNDGPLTVFDVRWAFNEMQTRTSYATNFLKAQAAAVAGFSRPQMSNMSHMVADSGVDGMRSAFCTLAVSFAKGWGGNYPRSSIKETPCWIEIQLHRPLQLLDHLLKTTGPL